MKKYALMLVGLALAGSHAALAVSEKIVSASSLPPVWANATGQAQLSAVKVAQRDADRRMLERIRGVQIDAKTHIYDFILADDTIEASIRGVLSGVKHDAPQYDDDGQVRVVAKLMMKDIIATLKQHIRQKKIAGIPVTVERLDELEIQVGTQILEELGVGALPDSVGYQRLLARRAAQVDAYRELVGRVLGMEIDSQTKVQNLVLASDKLKVAIQNAVRGAEEIQHRYDEKNSCFVTMKLKLEDIYRVIEVYSSGDVKDRIDRKVSEFTVEGMGAARPEGFQDTASTATAGDIELIIVEHLGRRVAY